MKHLLIRRHRYGFNIEFTHNVIFDMDYNNWHFLPSIEFYRRPVRLCVIIFAFLCFTFKIYRWRLEDAK